MSIHFEKANLNHIPMIFEWLAQPYIQEFWDNTQYIQEFWDNTQGHKDDILNFVNGRILVKRFKV